jgi:hypothetical protein
MQLFRNRRGDSRSPHALAAGLGSGWDLVLFWPGHTRYVRQLNDQSNFYWDGDGKPAQQL